MPSRNPCRLYIHLAFTCSSGSHKRSVKRTWTGSAFSTNESAWSVNGHGLSVSCVKWPYSEANCAPYSYCSPDHRILFQSTTTWCTIFDILPNCHFLCPTLESRNSVHPFLSAWKSMSGFAISVSYFCHVLYTHSMKAFVKFKKGMWEDVLESKNIHHTYYPHNIKIRKNIPKQGTLSRFCSTNSLYIISMR